MNGRYLLDTNIAIRVLNQQVDLRSRRRADVEVFLSVTVVGELLFGAEKSQNSEANRSRVHRLVEVCPVVPLDLETAARYGLVKTLLRSKGRPIPENDIWIAACALRHGLILATGDRHFEHVDGLRLDSW